MPRPLDLSKRLISLDALRGYTIALMVIVNNPGSWSHVYPPLLHARWHGITLTDLVFPLFLFVLGVSITLAYSKRLDVGADRQELYLKVVSRAVKILLLGWLLRLLPDFDFAAMRYLGVLPRISIVFLACGLLFLSTTWKQQIWIAALVLIGYWLLLALMPVPIDDVVRNALATGQVTYSDGQLKIGPIHELSGGLVAANYEPGVNITAWLDRQLLPGTLWEVTWDPEGLTSTLPAIVTGMIGMLVGRLILAIEEPYRKLAWIFFAGFAMYLAGGLWGWFMPLNKNLWTSSYTLWTAGMGTMALAACILVVDVLGYTRGTAFGRVLGANAIVLYVLSVLLARVLHAHIFGGMRLSRLWMDGLSSIGIAPRFASLAYAVLFMLVIYGTAYLLYRKRIFIKL
jgi:predicted acyltransferase